MGKMTLKNILIPFLVVVSMVSCARTQLDESPPLVEVKAPFNDAVYRVGDTLPVKLVLTDNADLSTLFLRIHDNRRIHSEDVPASYFLWDTIMQFNVFGTITELDFQFPLPDNLPFETDFHCVLECMDDAGNSSGMKEINFSVNNLNDTVSPSINLQTQPPIAAFANQNFAVVAQVEDNVCLKSVEVRLTDSSDSLHHEIYIDEVTIDGAFFQLSEFIKAPALQADYTLNITAKDALDNETKLLVPVMVL